jgi:hypothetical protein
VGAGEVSSTQDPAGRGAPHGEAESAGALSNVPVGDGSYDSTAATEAHIHEVRSRLDDVINELLTRAIAHDASKLEDPEKAIFDEYTPKLGATTYGSPEYHEHLKGMGVGLEHHYQVNDHHPEHHPNGVDDMDLLQLIEMLADWKAATMRHADGDLRRSIEQNKQRFDYSTDTELLLLRTAEHLGWL